MLARLLVVQRQKIQIQSLISWHMDFSNVLGSGVAHAFVKLYPLTAKYKLYFKHLGMVI